MNKTEKILVGFGWLSEILIALTGMLVAYNFIFPELANPEQIIIGVAFCVMGLCNLTKIPLATAVIYSVSIIFKFVFFVTLLLLIFVSFETMIQGFELYLVKSLSDEDLQIVNFTKYFIISGIISVLGVAVASVGLFLNRIRFDKEFKKMQEEKGK